MALKLGQASDSKGITRKVRDRTQSKAQLEVLQPGTFGTHRSEFHPAARDTSVTCATTTARAQLSHLPTTSATGTHNLLSTTSPKLLGPSASGRCHHFEHG